MVAPYPAPPYQPQPGNGLAVAGMVLGIIGLALCWIPFFGWALAVVGVILSVIGISKANKTGKGKGMAIAGLVCGAVGLLAGIVLFFLVFTAVKRFETYAENSRRSMEERIQLRRIEAKVKMFYVERNEFPKSAPEMPGKIADVCKDSKLGFSRLAPSAWTEGWIEMDFYLDDDSRCSYEFVRMGPRSAKAIARCDHECDGAPTESTVTLEAADGAVTATYSK